MSRPAPALPLTLPVRFSLVCTGLLCALPFLQPWHRNPLPSFYSEWLAAMLGLGVLALLFERRCWQDYGVPWIALAPCALAVLLVVHGVLGWSPYSGQALTGALYLLWAGALMVAGHALLRVCGADTVYRTIALSLAAGALCSAFIGIVQHWNLITPLNMLITRPTGPAIFGNLAQANHYASQVTLGLLSLAYLHGSGRITGGVAVAGTVPLLFVLGLSGSRSVWLYLLTAFVLAAWLRMATRQQIEPRAGQRLFFATGSFVILYYVMQLMVDAGWLPPSPRQAVTAVERLFSGAASIAERLSLWRAAGVMMLNNPVAGIGWGEFPARYFDYMTTPDAAGSFGLYQHAHNLVLHLLAETGVIGASLALLLALVWLRQVLAGGRHAEQWWLLAVAGVLGIHSLLEFPLWYAYFLGPAALLAGIVPTRTFMPSLARFGPLLALGLVLTGVVNLATLWTDYRVFERIFFSTRQEPLPEADVAQTISRLHRNPLLMPYVELATALPLTADVPELEQRLFLTERTLRFAPLATLLYREVLLLALADRPREAQALLARARRAYPEAPPEFGRDLARLAQQHPERMRPLLESGLRDTDRTAR